MTHADPSGIEAAPTFTEDVPWEATAENGFDVEMIDLFRVHARLHLRLFPYAWTYAQRLAEDGRPLERLFDRLEPGLEDAGVRHGDIYLRPVVDHTQVRQRCLDAPGGQLTGGNPW